METALLILIIGDHVLVMLVGLCSHSLQTTVYCGGENVEIKCDQSIRELILYIKFQILSRENKIRCF